MSIKLKYTIYGVLFGVCFPVFAILLEIATTDLQWCFSSIGKAHHQNVLIYMIDSAPLWLGIFALLGGISKQKADKLVEKFKSLAEELNKSNDYLSTYSHTIFETLFGSSHKIEELTKLLTNSSAELYTANASCSSEAETLTNSASDLQNSTENLIELNKNSKGFNFSILEKIEDFTSLNKTIAENFKGIEEIGLQIRILSINAGIESHKYGEIGKNFNVIAREIKSLSERIDAINKKTAEVSIIINEELLSLKQLSTSHREEIVKTNEFIAQIEKNTQTNRNSVSSISEQISNSMHVHEVQKDQFTYINQSLRSISEEKSEIIGKLKNIIDTNNKLIKEIGEI